MTQPDGFNPDDAANYSSLEAFGAKSAEDWQADQQSGLNANLDQNLSGFRSILGMIGLIPVVGPTLSNLLGMFLGFFGLGSGDVTDPDSVNPTSAWGNVVDLFLKPLNAFVELVGGFINVLQIPILDPSKILNLPALFTGTLTAFQNIFTNWFGGTSSATTVSAAAAEVAVTVEAIRVLTKDGYTLQTFVASNPSWAVPPELAGADKAWAGVIGGGGKGYTGAVVGSSVAYASGGFGGNDGGYTLVPINPSSLASTLAIVIGAAATTSGANGGTSSISSGGSPLATSTPGVSGISTPEGYQATSSKPGSGGRGGLGFTVSGNQAAADPGTPGEASATAAGGAGGSGSAGGNGSLGATGGLPISGGSGGGGGAGRTGFALTGYAGGNGGYPGGASGGGGGVGSTGGGGAGGPGGTPAAGFAFLIWK